MKKNEVEKRERLSKELEMSFDETLELFSEETLGTMVMTEVMGGGRTRAFATKDPCMGSNFFCNGCLNIPTCNSSCKV